jgi:hypothetical protein
VAYIGASPTTAAFLTDTFSANGSGTVFTLSTAPANTNSILVAVSGVLQDPSTYSVSGTTLTFSAAPPAGTGNISVRFLGIPASGVVTTAYRTQTEFTATAGQTTFTPPSYTVGFIDVYRNGVLLGSADFTATNGTTVVLTNPATAGDLIETVSFFVSSVLNAIPATAGAVTEAYLNTGAVTPAKISTGGPSWDGAGNLAFNSGYGSNATAYGCRAWVNFNGTGTVTIRASGNVSSITDNGTGDYTVNFTTALTDANYCVSALAGYNNFISAIVRLDDSPAQTTTALKLECSEGTGALADTPQFNVAIFR